MYPESTTDCLNSKDARFHKLHRMRFTILAWVVVLLSSNFFIGSRVISQNVTNKPQQSQLTPAKAKEAKRLFKQRCAKCHGKDGAANTTYGQIVGATNLTDTEWQQRVDDKRLVNSIKHGRGQMPGFGEKLNEEQITQLASYVRAFTK
jgi:cbb3-type cytochrome c oxidase subunit III